MAEKNCFDVCHYGAVVKELLAPTDKPGSTTGDAVFGFFVRFFFLFGLFLTLFFLLAFFSLFLLLTLLVHALGSIHILSVSPEFILEKGFQKLLNCILAKLMHLSMSCRRGGGFGLGMGWGLDCLCWPCGRAFD